jgi:branched-chain amino acid transport system ATP-binding protein
MAILEVKEISKHFGGIQAVSELSFNLTQGEILAIIGPNGAGKTTLFNLISGFYFPDTGHIIFDGLDITKISSDKRCHLGIGRTFQICQPFNELSILDNVLLPATFGKTAIGHRKDVKERVDEIISMVGMETMKDLFPAAITPSYLKRLEIARAIATKPRILILDEVMAGLLPHEYEEVIELIKKINQSGITVVLVEHVMPVVRELAQRVIVLNQGKKLYEGSFAEVIADERVINAYMGKEGE